MKTNISYAEGTARAPRSLGVVEFDEWLIELTSVDYPEIVDVEIVYARSQHEAVYNAFGTRNIASSWKVTEVEKAN